MRSFNTDFFKKEYHYNRKITVIEMIKCIEQCHYHYGWCLSYEII